MVEHSCRRGSGPTDHPVQPSELVACFGLEAQVPRQQGQLARHRGKGGWPELARVAPHRGTLAAVRFRHRHPEAALGRPPSSLLVPRLRVQRLIPTENASGTASLAPRKSVPDLVG